MPYFQNEGFRMHYDIHAALVPVDTLLIHGNVGSNLWWQPAIDAWAGRVTRHQTPRPERKGSLVVAEWRGCGRSSGPSSEAELEPSVLARDYLELLASLGIQKANLIAHSSGGLIALEALRRAPEVFQRAVLIDPVSARGIEVSDRVRLGFLEMSRHRDVLKAALSRAVHHFNPSSPFFERLVDDAFGAHPVVWAGMLKRLGGVSTLPELARIRQPVLVLHGERDRVLPVEGSMEIASLLPEGRFELLSDQGHSVHVENPERFVEVAHRFLFG